MSDTNSEHDTDLDELSENLEHSDTQQDNQPQTQQNTHQNNQPETQHEETTDSLNNQVLTDEEFARRLQEEFDNENQVPQILFRFIPITSDSRNQNVLTNPIPISGNNNTQGNPNMNQDGSRYSLYDYLRRLQSQLEPRPDQDQTEEEDPIDEDYDPMDDDDDQEEVPDDEEEHRPQFHPMLNMMLNLFQNSDPNVRELARMMVGDIDTSYEGLLRLSELIPPVSKGADPETIASLPTTKIQSLSNTPEVQSCIPEVGPSPPVEGAKCIICLGEYGEGDEVTILPGCNHSFHKECISQWLGQQKTCPICRIELIGSPPTKPSIPR